MLESESVERVGQPIAWFGITGETSHCLGGSFMAITLLLMSAHVIFNDGATSAALSSRSFTKLDGSFHHLQQHKQ